jgi:hypothetical protein
MRTDRVVMMSLLDHVEGGDRGFRSPGGRSTLPLQKPPECVSDDDHYVSLVPNQ